MATELAEAHIEGQAQIRAAAVAAVGQAWADLGSYDEDQVPVFTSAAVAVSLAAQRAAVALTNAFLAAVLGRQPLALDVDRLVGSAVRNGTQPAEVYRRPFVTTWTALKQRRLYETAVAAGLERATGTVAIDPQLSMRATLVEVGRQDATILGYARVPDADACEFCRLISGQRYTVEDLMPVHNRCGCGVDVITAANRDQYGGKRSNDLALPTGVAVHEHGELGPVLADSSHDFTLL